MPGEAASSSEGWFFGCSACGKCCNSPPRLLLPELFRHQTRFVGCLALQRRGFQVELFVHAFGFASAAACPALADDGRCSLHDEGKPRVCGIVPLDATLSDAEQHGVLTARHREARFWGADCIRSQPASGFRELTRHLRVVDPEAAEQLALHRRELADERRFWADDTARLLGPELLDHPERVRTLPEDGALSISLVPVLSLLAETSPRCRERVKRFVHEQNRLKSSLIEGALQRRNAGDRDDTALLRKLLKTGQLFAAQLARALPAGAVPASASAPVVEAWLGV